MISWSDFADRYGLTKTQSKIVAALADGQIRSRDELMAAAIGRKYSCDRLISVHVSRANARLKVHGAEIEFVRGSGYRFIPETAA